MSDGRLIKNMLRQIEKDLNFVSSRNVGSTWTNGQWDGAKYMADRMKDLISRELARRLEELEQHESDSIRDL